MNLRIWNIRICLVALALSAPAFAADHPDLSGTWQGKSEVIEIQQKEGAIQITTGDPAAKDKKLDIRCNTLGKECKLKDEQVSLWFNGPMLVLMETRHGSDAVIEKRMKLSEDGKTLTMEVLHIAPPADRENLLFTRQEAMKANR